MPCWLPWKQWQDLNSTLFFFFPCLCCSRQQPRQGSILCSGRHGWPDIASASLFCHSTKRFSRYLRAGGWSYSKASLWKGLLLGFSSGTAWGKQFSPSFSWKAQRREAQKPEVTCPCLHSQHKWQKRTLHLDVWSQGEWHTQPLTRGSLKCL